MVESYCRTNNLTAAASDRITHELAFQGAFARILTKAKASIKFCRNTSRYLVPIHTLPSEILIHILNLAGAVGHESCKEHETPYCLNRIHLQPVVFASVCVQWRTLMFQFPTFWSRIDLVHGHRAGWNIIPRAKIWAECAGLCPLDIRVAVVSCNLIEKGFVDFLNSIATRTLGSLSFILENASDVNEGTFFKLYFSNWAPGTLKKLIIEKTKHSGRYSRLIKSSNSVQQHDSESYLFVDLPDDLLEALWRPVTVLRLHGIYIDWGSQAYHGLTELSLLPSRETHESPTTSIRESQFKMILMSSPGLRVLRFGLAVAPNIGVILTQGEAIIPVQLNDLELLDLDFDRRTETSLKYILRWVAPGPKPLILLLPRSYGAIPGSDLVAHNRPDIQSFLVRAKVTELCMYIRDPALDWLFSLTPHLRTLAVWLSSSLVTSHNETQENIDSSYGTIDKIYVLASTLKLNTFCQWLSRCPPTRALVYWRCVFLDDEGKRTYQADEFIKQQKTPTVCSHIENITDEPCPIGGWRASRHGYTYSI
ncbi:unnamed protein product [Rhizoctonia solani]|uniref:F-box domain-containing protein n=1 Tax=Rhizoctonia solani TaxID=456999 RepID=A0A8H2WKA5_9AGAM|nr:unnamed protein product [Rhizoctonia solani]